MNRKPNQTKLNVESLEGRELTASTFAPSVQLSPVTAIQSSQISSNIQVNYTLTADAVSATRNLDWVSGLRINHNETAVRSRKPRRKARA